MNDMFILEKLKKKFKYIVVKDEKILLSNSSYNNGEIIPEYECRIEGTFTSDRDRRILVSNMGSIELNLIGLYCSLCEKPSLTIDEKNSLINAKSQYDINQVFEKSVGKDYISNNLVFNPQILVNNSINVITSDNLCNIYCVKGEKMLKIASLSNNDNNIVFRTILKSLKSKKNFESVIVDDLHLESIVSEDILKLFAIYEYKMPVNLLNVEKKNKSL